MSRIRCFVTIAAAALLAAPASHAMINPGFTPVHLVKQASVILWVDIKAGEAKDAYTARIRETLKGKAEEKTFRLEISQAGDDEAATAMREQLAVGKPALFFVGEFEDTKELGGGNTSRRAFLLLDGVWSVFGGGEQGLWKLNNINDRMLMTVWHGGTDMMRRAVDYIQTDDDPKVPVAEGFSFSKGPLKLASLTGAIRAVRTVDLAGDGKLALFVACESGDRLFVGAKGRTFTDLTETRGLQSKSVAFAWGDFARKGRLDLISFDGKVVTLNAQQADGKFLAKPLDFGGAVSTACVALAALDVGIKERSGLLVSGDSWPVLVTLDEAGKATATPLAAPGVELAKLGKPGAGLVADFDGDGLADVLLPAEKGSVLFCATALGKFAPGVACAVNLGKSPSGACLGDFDGDGRLDVFCANRSGSYLWENAGGGTFVEAFEQTGELSYGTSSRGSDCMAGDFNNDGRQDIVIGYSAAEPRIFFNRGFRSFGNAASINMGWKELLPGVSQACFGRTEAGAMTLKWRLPGGQEQTREVVLEKGGTVKVELK